MEMGKLMRKFNQNQLQTIFKNFFRPNNTVHSHWFEARSKTNYRNWCCNIYTMEMGKLMHKFNQNQLRTIFKNFFRPNNTVHSHSTRNRYAYHLPFHSTSVSLQSIQFSGAKVWNALPSDIRALQLRSAFVTKLKKHLS